MQTPTQHQQASVLSPFCEFAQQGEDVLAAYLEHVGISGERLKTAPTVADAILQHYRVGKRYDVDRVAYDLLRWPPIAARIRQLEIDRAEEQAAREASRMRKTRAKRTSQPISPDMNGRPH